MSRPSDPLERAQDTSEVLRLFTLGYTNTRIAKEIGKSADYVETLIREAAADFQKKNSEHVSAAYMQQDASIVFLYEKCVQEILSSPVFPEKAILAAIKLHERRSRLLGLDRAGPVGGRGGGGWSCLRGDEGPRELEAIAKGLGIPVPVPFTAVAHA